jgi:hypothetical protein
MDGDGEIYSFALLQPHAELGCDGKGIVAAVAVLTVAIWGPPRSIVS